MLNLYNFFLCSRLKQKHLILESNKGFTLIELLVAMILAVLVITPLLGFMINILDNDRREQAKVASEQEAQTALDYIAQDLQQAIYIYDAKGITKIKDQLPNKDMTDRVPVLVFWKRKILEESIPFTGSITNKKLNDTFVYSLVVYYLIQDNNVNDKNKMWSNQFRIARFEVKDGIRDSDNPYKSNGDINYVKDKDGKEQTPDQGFALFKLNDTSITGTLEDKMNGWKKKEGEDYVNNANVLIDYVDASNKDALLDSVDCTTVFPLDNIPAEKQDDKKQALQVPAFNGKFSYSSLTQLSNNSFYACVDVDKVSAKIFIRGNAYARIEKTNNTFDKSKAAYFPNVNVQVKGKGIIGVE